MKNQWLGLGVRIKKHNKTETKKQNSSDTDLYRSCGNLGTLLVDGQTG